MGQLHVSPGLHMLQAFVDFDSGAEAERAITTKDRQVFAQKFGDRYVRLVQACSSPRHIHVCGILSTTTSTTQLAMHLSTQFALRSSFASGLFVPVAVLCVSDAMRIELAFSRAWSAFVSLS